MLDVYFVEAKNWSGVTHRFTILAESIKSCRDMANGWIENYNELENDDMRVISCINKTNGNITTPRIIEGGDL